jgi:hypothetical protein
MTAKDATSPPPPCNDDVRTLPPGAVEIHGKVYLHDAHGSLVPLELVRAVDLLRDQLVRDLVERAEAVNKAIVAFKTHAFTEIATFQALVDERYGAKLGGQKGNISLATYDGLQRVQVQVSDMIRFDSVLLQTCKTLVDECVSEWSADSRSELRQVVMNAFNVDKAGQINRGALLGLLKLNITDERWMRGMDALRDSIKVDATKSYIRVHTRSNPDAPFIGLSLDAATA